jgi:hypothetical protein
MGPFPACIPGRCRDIGRTRRWWGYRRRLSATATAALLAAVVVVAVAVAAPARASLRRDGTWPQAEAGTPAEPVSLSVHGVPRAEAVRLLAEKAGWSVVLDGPAPGTVDVEVVRQPAASVLELILGQSDYVARRQGTLVSIRPDTPKVGARPERRSSGGKDRVVTGGEVVVQRDEVVGDLAIFRGSVDVFGRVTGEASVFGGSLTVHEGGRIEGDVSVFGGSVSLRRGARIAGDLGVLGGDVHRDPGASVGGDTTDAGGSEGDGAALRGDEPPAHGPSPPRRWSFRSVAAMVGSAVTRTSLLFAFGAILLALMSRRLDLLQGDVATRPARAFAIGVVGVAGGLAATAALCVTVVGIPIAVLALLLAIFGTYAGVCATLTAAGALVLGHRTTSAYAHLAAGCAIYLLLSSLPHVGHVVTAVVILVGFGTLLQTRAAGLVRRFGAGASADLPPE